MARIEGRRGMPRPRPPFPAVVGPVGQADQHQQRRDLRQHPLDHHQRRGCLRRAWAPRRARAPRSSRWPARWTTRGLAEVPMGITMREMVYDVGGGIKRRHARSRPCRLGGPSGGCVPAEHARHAGRLRVAQAATGAIMGSGGMVVVDETTCMVDLARYFLQFTQNESLRQVRALPPRAPSACSRSSRRITAGEGEDERHRTPARSSPTRSRRTSLCGLGQTAPNPVLTTHHATSATSTRRTSSNGAACRARRCKAPCSAHLPAGVDTSIPRARAHGLSDACAPRSAIRARVAGASASPRRAQVQAHEIDTVRSAHQALMADTVARLRSASRSARSDRRRRSPWSAPVPAGSRAPTSSPSPGYPVTVFEGATSRRRHARGGPARRFSMPKDVVAREVQAIARAWASRCVRGRAWAATSPSRSLLDGGYEAVFLAIGAHETQAAGRRRRGRRRRSAGHRVPARCQHGRSRRPVGAQVAVVGGGSVAMDAARSALRLQEMAGLTRDVTLVYRRSERRDAGVRMGSPRGVRRRAARLLYLVARRRVVVDNQAACPPVWSAARMELGEPDESGRRRPSPVAGSEFVVDCDTLIPAIGQSVDLSRPRR